ncbi:DUF4884 domain-containing protein [Dysgonomonas sp. HGC4]|uniref:DUF4884 domain-containing protein n=1 Tax=Dysgonomonas sp. HGC4 TaxID=1658009 RepID=UPI000680426A|nr:DUF4884 domain-containing protein [Dysgonomonas sp. HGC4]MBD8348103.1 DUF4884 domain-containing protein [Dysgonomonas sp. HGC4]
MKTLIILSFATLLLNLSSCGTGEPLVRTKTQNNSTYKVDYLFEHDGCKVYRFEDDGKYVYFTNCIGDVSVLKSDSTRTQIQTVGRHN